MAVPAAAEAQKCCLHTSDVPQQSIVRFAVGYRPEEPLQVLLWSISPQGIQAAHPEAVLHRNHHPACLQV